MSLEQLISKYIDGDLTHSEDTELRSILKNNTYAKDKFDRSVELHLDLLEDSRRITVPRSTLKKTEEAVLMRIFSEPALVSIPKTEKKVTKFKFRFPAVAAVIALFTILNLFEINDKNYPREISIFSPISEQNNIVNSTSKQINNVKSNEIAKNIAENEIYDIDNEILNDALTSEVATNFSDISEINSTIIENEQLFEVAEELSSENSNYDNVVISSENSDRSINTMHLQNNIPNNFNESSRQNLPNFNFGFNGPEITSVQFNTVVSRDFARTGIATSNNSQILNYSQSIGYSLSGNSVIGLEFGVTEMSYDYTKFIAITSIGINEPIGNGSPGGGNAIRVPVRLQRQEQFFWGIAFYDINILNSDNFSLNSTIGIGSTSDSPLGLGRISAKYKILNNLAVTLGTEGRIFLLKTPLLSNSISTVSSYGIVYGVQLNL